MQSEPEPPKPMRSYSRGGLTAPPRPDPRKENVFQRGPDGQLHPIPGWHTTGPFDFDAWSHNIDWDGVQNDISDISEGAVQFILAFEGAGSPGSILKPRLFRRRVGDNINGHHSYPRFMRGPDVQELVELPKDFHRLFHKRLKGGLEGKGVPRVGGRGGGRKDWDEFFDKNAGAQDWAEDVLQQTSRDFDIERGTSIAPSLEKQLQAARARRRSPPPDRSR